MKVRFLLLLAMLIFSGCSIYTTNTESYNVVAVVDGDTLVVSIDDTHTERVRLIGIDTPELGSDTSTPECYAEEAKVALTDLVASSTLRLERDLTQADRDVFGRLLRYVYTEDGTLVNATLIAEGYAREFTYDVPYRLQKNHQDAESKARKEKLGLWSNCNI